MKAAITPATGTGALLTTYCKKNKIYKAELARKMGVEYQQVIYYLRTKSMDIQKLIDFSQALSHNFLMDLALQLPSSYTTDAVIDTTIEQENIQLKEQIKILEAEKEVLLRVIGNRL